MAYLCYIIIINLSMIVYALLFLEINPMVQSAILAHKLQENLNFEWKLITDGTSDLFDQKFLGAAFYFIFQLWGVITHTIFTSNIRPK